MRMERDLRKLLDKNKPVPHHSVKTIIKELDGITEIGFADSFITIKPMSKTQRECLKIFNTEEPVSKYVENITVPNMLPKFYRLVYTIKTKSLQSNITI